MERHRREHRPRRNGLEFRGIPPLTINRHVTTRHA